ncbi:hypothetical protein EV356DRAFT_540029 [Viridothelium virens]|uniref:Uncharacterized protein n=1 Tax=Viridothelium virens TaxID=1048519 RepID=A0A6A6HI18_VIRVR|nr:hypothetical protein EV356DRAFT_540029 [Viridothelium virens]
MALPFDPTVLFTGINNAFKLAKFCLELKEASEELHVFGALINRVRKDRAEALRVRRETAAMLEVSPPKRDWVDGTITDIDEVLFQIGLLLEDARLDNEIGKSVKLQHRFEWVLSVKGEFLVKHALLSTCHQSMMSALSAMETMKPGAGELPVPQSAEGVEDIIEQDRAPLRPPGQRRRRHKVGSFITYEPLRLSTFVEEYDEALFQRQSAELEKSVSISEESLDQSPTKPPSPDIMWDDIDPSEIRKAAANAIEKQGKGIKSAPSLALPLREIEPGSGPIEPVTVQERGGASGRRRKLAAKFADG